MGRFIWAGLVAIAVGIPSDATAQRHALADSSLAPSLLTSALSIPMTRQYASGGSELARRFSRLEVQYGRTSTPGVAPTVILGFRSDGVSFDSLEWNASTFGVRTGFARAATDTDDIKLSAVEVYLGGRSLGHMDGRVPNIGAEIVAGWSRIEANTRASLALRFPTEFIRGRGRTSVALSVVPAIAWGQLRFRSCEDLGSGDGCSPHGFNSRQDGRASFSVRASRFRHVRDCR